MNLKYLFYNNQTILFTIIKFTIVIIIEKYTSY